MFGPGYCSHMMGFYGTDESAFDQKFLDETTDLRKEHHNKKFEHFEATRNPETTTETITKLEKEIAELQNKIHKKALRRRFGSYGGYGCRW